MIGPERTAPLAPEEIDLARIARDAASGLGGVEPAPGDHAAEDEQARLALAAVAASGLTAQLVARPHGAGGGPAGFSVRRACAIREELAHGSALADVMFVMQGLGSAALALAGTGALKDRWLPRVASGAVAAAFALTEPEAGSDVASLAAAARRDGDRYLITGVKTLISNAGVAGLYTLFARTGGPGSGRDGISAFALDAATPGLTFSRLTVTSPHPIGTLELSDCLVPASCRIGEEGEGFGLAMKVLDRFRPTVGAAAVGFARRALEESVSRARARRQFGRPIGEFQAIRFKLADMATRLEAARLLVYRAASLRAGPRGSAPATGRAAREARRAAAMAKLFATEAAQRIVDEAVQIHGGAGVTRGSVVERLYRDVRALRIYEGTSEVQRLVIAATL